jgi:hypothetical protein
MNQGSLFNKNVNISGLTYIPSYISSEYQEKLLKLMETQSLLILRDDSRYKWKHGLTGRKSDSIVSVKGVSNLIFVM